MSIAYRDLTKKFTKMTLSLATKQIRKRRLEAEAAELRIPRILRRRFSSID